MLKKLKQRQSKSDGFTIIEVMIVLAIAGLILLIVFLAVPALQRNSRNTQAKNEASNILGAVNEYITNNNGALPPAGSAPAIITDANVKNITGLTVEIASASSAPTATTAILRTGSKCVAAVTSGYSGAAATATGAASRQFALLYPMENNSGNATGCIGS